MDATLLFSDRSIWTMVHGIGLGGGALLGLVAALTLLGAAGGVDLSDVATQRLGRSLAVLTVFTAVALWLTVIVGTYVTFPSYRVTPPEGVVDLTRYPRSLLLSSPATAWLHAFAMEIKEHVPWIAAMLATAVAFIAARDRTMVLPDPAVRRIAAALLGVCFVLVAAVSLLGVFINKVAPLE